MTVAPTATLAAPALVSGRYRLGASLGRGGMGEVFEAVDERTGEPLAVKNVRRAAATPRALTRVLREASAAASVDHPNVVRVLDAGDDDESEVAFIAQELLRGATLREALVRRGALPCAEATAIAEAVADGLAAVHAVGVVHRDLKPENIFLQRVEGAAPRPLVIDFGIARLVDPDADEAAVVQFTSTGTVLGTPRYMSLEQVRAAPDVDEQTDVWALGAVLFEMLSGDAPFARESPHATLAAILLDPIPRLHRDVPRSLVETVERALTRDRVERFGTMREFGDALRGVPVATTAAPRGRWLVLAAAAPFADVASAASPATTSTVVPAPAPRPHRGRRPPLGAAATDGRSHETTPEDRSAPRVNGAPILWL